MSTPTNPTPLPVDSVLGDLLGELQRSKVVLFKAPPGSGKTTRVAPALIAAGLCDANRRCFLLQPRRVAATSTAQRIANERQWQLGKEVGYQVRFDRKTSAETSLVVATDGVLLRRLGADPAIEDVGCVILDEFHERSLNQDLLLGMLLRIQQVLRDDLQLIVMSATLETDQLAGFLGAPVVSTTGTLHPVSTHYRPAPPRVTLVDHAVDTILATLKQQDGDVLVFLPGVAEINQVARQLQQPLDTQHYAILPLHGSLPLAEQSAVLRPHAKRKIVLATNVAETSLTIEGIRTVIDTGQVRVMRFHPATGLNRLELEPHSQASAAQRAGRAGRIEAGTCVRLWDEASQRARAVQLEPEVRRVDLASAVLQLHLWGEDPFDFPWIDAPRPDAIQAANLLLTRLGAISEGTVTQTGQQMSRLPLPPRIARLLLHARRSKHIEAVTLVAAMLSERAPFLRDRNPRSRTPVTRQTRWECDVSQRLSALQAFYDTRQTDTPFGEIHRNAAAALKRTSTELQSALKRSLTAETESKADLTSPANNHTLEDEDLTSTVSRALLAAFPERLARRRKPGDTKGRMAGGRGVKLAADSGVRDAELFLCVDVDASKQDAFVRQATSIRREWLDEDMLDTREELFFNPTAKRVDARLRTYWFDLVITEHTAMVSDSEQCAQLLYEAASLNLSAVMPDAESPLHAFVERVRCLQEWAPELGLPDIGDDFLKGVLKELCVNRRSFAELRTAPWLDWVRAELTAEQQHALENECPESCVVPSGSRIRLQYRPGAAPVLAVRIQEVFSWQETPRIAFGRVPLLLHLLAPNMRPQQVTDDLASFWSTTYTVVRKELRRRYPKHSWPEDPKTARPVRGVPKKKKL